MHWLSPSALAICPSRDVASFRVTYGLPRVCWAKKPIIAACASCSLMPVVTLIPAFRSLPIPRPLVRESGSWEATTTRLTPASMSKWLHVGPRGESWKQGSNVRSEEHTSELQSLMRISYAVFCLKKKKNELTLQAIYKIIQE